MFPESNHRNLACMLWEGIAAWYQRDQCYRELATLDVRELKDIGITRADIPAIVSGTFPHRGDASNGDN